MITIAIANQKGGVGKTATSVNLAAFLGQKHSTLLVDFDPQGHCAQAFALDANLLSPTVYDVLFGRAETPDAIRALRERASLLPANRENAKETPAARRANEALDRVTGGDKTPVKKALAFLLADSHDEPVPEDVSAQTKPKPSPIQTQSDDSLKTDQAQPIPSPISIETKDSSKVAQSQPKPNPIAPERNFNKRANSLEHSALPAGQFPGASKKIYDALYVRTRGAIVPARTVQARHRELLAWSGVKDIKTIKTHLNKLREQGLITWQTLKGEHEGSFYEVFLPEEVSPIPAQWEPEPKNGLRPSPKNGLGWAT